MQIFLGILFATLPGLLVVGQFISVFNFPLAQRLGLQEKPDHVDPLLTRLEYNTAVWDLLSLIWLLVAGVLMILDHPWWPLLAIIGGTAYVDAGGRESAKIFGLRSQGVETGSSREQRLFAVTYLITIILGLMAIIFALSHLASIR